MEKDQALWNSYTNCNSKALEILFEENIKKLIASLEMLKNNLTHQGHQLKHLTAEDFIQDFFEGLIIEKESYKGIELKKRFIDWAFHYCKLKLMSENRKDSRRLQIQLSFIHFQPNYIKPLTNEGIEEIENCMISLKPNHKKILELQIKGLKNKEIAKCMDRSEKWVTVEKNRARTKLRECLKFLET